MTEINLCGVSTAVIMQTVIFWIVTPVVPEAIHSTQDLYPPPSLHGVTTPRITTSKLNAVKKLQLIRI
jgi:hypothetical protein